jgi:histidinol-phosphate aminotransferase
VDRLARLAANEGALGPSPLAMAAYRALSGEIHRYPDGDAAALRQAIGAANHLDPARIVCGAGSDEILQLLARSYAGPGDEVLYSAHGFLVYPIAAQAAGATPVTAPERNLTSDVDALLARVTERTRILFLANPNNPTGSFLSGAQLDRLHAGLPGQVLLVIDAAYAEYVERDDYADGAALVDRAANVVMVRTFSKIYALGALRLGWAYCPPAVADVYNRVRGPFNVSAPAQAAGIAALGDTEFLEASRRHNRIWRAWLADALSDLGLMVYPSVTNFVLVSFAPLPAAPPRPGLPADGNGIAEAARLALKARGVLTRQVGSYGLGHCLRISVGTEEEMRAVAEGLKAFLKGS